MVGRICGTDIFSMEWNTEGGNADGSGDNEDEELLCESEGN